MAKILIIDDEDDLRDGLRELLEAKGYEVLDAPDGITGTSCFREHGADLIITDLIMPLKDGIETIRSIRREFSEVKILAFSGRGGAQLNTNLSRAMRCGANATLEKPCEPETLFKTIEQLVGKSS